MLCIHAKSAQESGVLVQEFLNNPDAANAKYLAEDGESKVIIVNGVQLKLPYQEKAIISKIGCCCWAQ